jgi:hypothetical protein
VTAAAALAAVAAGVTAGPAAATGDLATGSHATAVLSAGHANSATLDAAATLVPFGQLAVPTGHAAPAPHQVPSQAPRQPVAKVRVAAAADAHGASGQQGKPGAQQPAAHSSPAAPPARHPAPRPKPYLIYDSVTPQAIPPHRIVATYATGGYAVPAAQVAGRSVVWIDTRGTDPAASALDVEPGDATPSVAASWAWHKLSASPRAVARIYTMISEWPAVKAAIASLPHRMQSHIRYWIADPTGVPHVVPGANATQWYWGKSYDISTANPGF